MLSKLQYSQQTFSLQQPENFKQLLLNYGNRFSNFCFLDSHQYQFDSVYDCICGIGTIDKVDGDKNDLSALNAFRAQYPEWVFGHISYDLKNEIEPQLFSQNYDGIGFQKYFFFVPEIVIILTQNEVKILSISKHPKVVFTEVMDEVLVESSSAPIQLSARLSKEQYLEKVYHLQKHIAKGDCYEICFCQEFFATDVKINPVQLYLSLSLISPNPFAAFYKLEEKYLICASPERFIKKSGDSIISQPIKGTLRRDINNENKLQEEILLLQLNEKERSENIMIVDLVRNDLAKICDRGSVYVKEFLEIYTFPQVHQMISTIEGSLNSEILVDQILKAVFPMGSMTGAPKIKAMELIEQYETTKRGLFSGSVGYFSPSGDFDFNVIIRSVLYNASKGYLSAQVGSAITNQSIAEMEYEECLLKIEAIKKVLR